MRAIDRHVDILFAARMKIRILAVSALVALSCAPSARRDAVTGYPWWTGRLPAHATAVQHVASIYKPGLGPLDSSKAADAWIYLPKSATDSSNIPLVVLLHGATQSGEWMIRNFLQASEETGIVLVAPKSREITWDVVRGYYGPDVANIDSVIQIATERYSIDPHRIFLAGFSDGASYALALGRLNGDFFTKVASFSPGILFPVTTRGSPSFFISHGTRDQILPIDQTSRVIVPQLRNEGLRVEYHEFDGFHQVTPEIASQALHWFLAR